MTEGRVLTPECLRLRQAFLDRLTRDSVSKDRRRRDYNQAIFDAEQGWAVFTGTDLDMVMQAFDRAVTDVHRDR